ncbi:MULTISPECIES: acyl-CoA dehydrogenase family protein [unclassified Mycobacterium]|uniref:acyl-CoA dehydrogenase family protein n=1 Tax=unclassified Mycobacterium TaxID=2642494 RepID=UPI00074022B2|nr:MULTISPECIES: acyl-CoA dehydrogenase family protein [unclassified Mycobacterium]KUH85507.1 acyl-CoA dehydrogenase [Mycobacterium sp. GA-1999]KUH91365.1 acyl-CoA dehydrogenase [Mycobacterium sp. GA-0227b]KUH96380.1 acyl-CoA dehydrogenase [Mycobacterium sp. IS-1556]
MRDSEIDIVESLLPAIADAASDVDRRGAVDRSVIVELHEAGFFSMLRPKAFGGLEADPYDYLVLTRELSSACTSTGWLAGMLGVNSWHLALFDERAQQDVWGSDPRALVCASYAPTGRLERVGRGYRLSGRWNRCTGIHHASWLIAAAVLVGDDGAAQDFIAALVPCADYTVESHWNGLGLRGIGADDVVVSNALVPAHRTFGWLGLDQRTAVNPLYRLPQPTLYTHTGTVPLLGAADNVLAARGPSAATALSAVAMATADLELSALQIRRNLTELMDCARDASEPDTALILRSRRDQVVASDRAVRAIQTFIPDSGTGIGGDALVERVWRDVQTARTHVASNVEQVLSVVGRFAFGLKVDDLIW